MRDVRRNGGGRGLCGGPGKRVDGVFPGRPQGFRHQAPTSGRLQSRTGGGWSRTAEQGVEHFMAKWIVAEKAKAGLRHAVVCPNVTGKDQGEDSPKQAGSCWFARPCSLATSGANSYPPGVWRLVCRCHEVFFRFLFCFVFVFMISLKPRPFVQSCFDMQAPK